MRSYGLRRTLHSELSWRRRQSKIYRSNQQQTQTRSPHLSSSFAVRGRRQTAVAAVVCLFADEAGLELALCYVFSWQQLARHSSFAEMKTISCAEAVSIHFLTGFQCSAVCARGGGIGGHPMRDINYSDPRNISVYVDYFQDLQL